MTSHFICNPDFSEFEQELPDIGVLFSTSTASIHKARNELRIVTLHGVDTVIKSFKIPHLLNQIVYTFFRRSKAYKSYHNALKLKSLHISTPTPIAYIEFYPKGLLRESYFISLHSPFDFTIREALHHTIDDYQSVLKHFCAYTHNLHQCGVWHMDYSPGNILIRRNGVGYEFNIVDINRMEFRDITPLQGCENFNKLWARDEDIEIMGREYARLSGLNVAVAIAEMKRHNDANKRVKNFKKQLKKVILPKAT